MKNTSTTSMSLTPQSVTEKTDTCTNHRVPNTSNHSHMLTTVSPTFQSQRSMKDTYTNYYITNTSEIKDTATNQCVTHSTVSQIRTLTTVSPTSQSHKWRTLSLSFLFRFWSSWCKHSEFSFGSKTFRPRRFTLQTHS